MTHAVLFYICLHLHFFFFSSRRRHTRCLSDWSSDVCSSDLRARGRLGGRPRGLSKQADATALAAETLYREGKLSVAQIAEKLSIAKSTLYVYLRHRGVPIGSPQPSLLPPPVSPRARPLSSSVRHGQTRQGKQRYRCREQRCAGRIFLLDYSYPGQSPEVKQQIVEMAMNASGIRDTARVLHVSTNTVMTELKKRNLTSST